MRNGLKAASSAPADTLGSDKEAPPLAHSVAMLRLVLPYQLIFGKHTTTGYTRAQRIS